MTPLPLRAQANEQGLAQLVPNLILTEIILPEAGAPGNPHAGHFTLGNPTFGGSQAGSQPDGPAIRAVEAFGDRLRAQFANFPLGIIDRRLHLQLQRAVRPLHAQHPEFWSGIHRTCGDHRPQEIQSRRQLSAHELRYLRRPGSAGRLDLFLSSAHRLLRQPGISASERTDSGVRERPDAGDAHSEGHNRYGGCVRQLRRDRSLRRGRRDPDYPRCPWMRTSTRRFCASRRQTTLVHTFTQGQNVTEKDFADSGSATGIGDVVLRTKYNFLRAAATWMSLGVDVRLPTGDADNLLGLGTTQGKFFFIASSNNQRFSPHVNIGFTVSGEGNRETLFQFEPLGVSDEFNYAGGVEIVAHPKLTLLADFLGRTLFDAGDSRAARPRPFRSALEPAPLLQRRQCRRARPTRSPVSRTSNWDCATEISRCCWARRDSNTMRGQTCS